MVCSVSPVVEGFGFSPRVISSRVSANSAVRRAPEAGRENNLVAERSLLSSAAYEQLNSMESSRLVCLYNLDPPGDPWCRTMNSWRQHCSPCSSSSSGRPTGNCWIPYHSFYDRQTTLLLFSTPFPPLYSLIYMDKRSHTPFLSAFGKWQPLHIFHTHYLLYQSIKVKTSIRNYKIWDSFHVLTISDFFFFW